LPPALLISFIDFNLLHVPVPFQDKFSSAVQKCLICVFFRDISLRSLPMHDEMEEGDFETSPGDLTGEGGL
jgi:hypothetical protein